MADGLNLRWDNMLRYSAALRLAHPNAAFLGYINGDDGKAVQPGARFSGSFWGRRE